MENISKREIWAIFFLGIVLTVSSFMMVELQDKTRRVFVAHEREVDMGRKLLDDQLELQMLVRKAALPSQIASGAKQIGLEGANGANTFTFVVSKNGKVAYSAQTKARLDVARQKREQMLAKLKAREVNSEQRKVAINKSSGGPS